MDEPIQEHSESLHRMAGLQHLEMSPIVAVLDYYRQSHDEIRAKLIGDEKDPVEIAKQFALLAMEQTRKLILRGNVYEDIKESKGKSYAGQAFTRDTLLCLMRDQKSVLNAEVMTSYRESVSKELQISPKDVDSNMLKDLMGLQVKTHLALCYQAGNCQEVAYVAIECLFMIKNKLGNDFADLVQNMRVVNSGKPYNHVFVEMDVKLNHDQTTVMICDPWAGYVGELKDIPSKLNVCSAVPSTIYMSENKVAILDNGLIALAFKHQTHLKNVTCFDLYNYAFRKETDSMYCQYLKSLPFVPTIAYQKEKAYMDYLKKEPIDYENEGCQLWKDLQSRYQRKFVQPVTEIGSVKVYSQPNLKQLQYQPDDKSLKYDADIDNPINSSKVEIKETKPLNENQQISDEKWVDKKDDSDKTLQKNPAPFNHTH